MKQKLTLLACTFIIAGTFVKAQQNVFPPNGAAGIGTGVTINPSSLLEIKSTSKGLLIPRMSKAQRDAIGLPAESLLIYQTNASPGFYYYDGTAWKSITAAAANRSLSNLANVAINTDLISAASGTLSLGSTGNAWKDLYLSDAIFVNGKRTVPSVSDANDNLLLGTGAGTNLTTGLENIAVGTSALNQLQTGSGNIAIGQGALFLNTASNNTAVGDQVMINNTSGYESCAFGHEALYSNTAGFRNSAFGYRSLYENTGTSGGAYNSAFGWYSLYGNTTGSDNAAFGNYALGSNSSGSFNVAMGNTALNFNGIGNENTGIGNVALFNNTSGNNNTGVGSYSLLANNTGSRNTGIGDGALFQNNIGSENTGIGYHSLSSNNTGSYNTAIGSIANVWAGNLTNATAIGYNAIADQSNKVRIGNALVTKIGGQVGWTTFSDGRYKRNIKENVPGLAFINSLRPITYTVDVHSLNQYYNKSEKAVAENQKAEAGSSVANAELNKSEDAAGKIIYNGFVAQEVEAAAKKLNYDFSGVDKPQSADGLYGLRYAEFVVPLVKAVQELSKTNDKLQDQVNAQQKEIDELKAIVLNKDKNSSSTKSATLSTGASMLQNAPNPFSNATTISYNIPQKYASAQIIITDNSGKQLKRFYLAGNNNGTLKIDASSFAPGTYYYSLVIDGKQYETKKMLLEK